MATLFDVTLDLARHARGLQRHKVSAVSDDGRTLTSATMENNAGEYIRGTLWVMSGDCAGQFAVITRAAGQWLTIADGEVYLGEGDIVMICPWIDFTLSDLINSVNSVLYRYPIYVWDDSLTWNPDQLTYDLPDGVSDIRQVKIENTNGDGTYTLSHCWIEENRQLRFHTSQALYKDGGKIQIGYRKMHGEVYEATDEIDPSVDMEYLRNMAFLYLWRTVIIIQHKDNPVAADMFNEAKLYESDHQKFNVPERNIPMRSFYTRY